jgi:Tol biopolymer transport system component
VSSFDLASRLEALVPPELARGDWGDVTRRLGTRRTLLRLKYVAVALFVVLVGAATATYFVLRSDAIRDPAPGALTLIAGGHSSKNPPRIVEVRPDGTLRVVWGCPAKPCGGYLTSLDWAPNGRYVAFSLDAFNFRGGYLGLHILDTRTGRAFHLGSEQGARLGCTSHGVNWNAYAAVAWSPDSRTLAFSCTRGIYLIRSDGTGVRRISTGAWPTWSDDGKRIAFEGGPGRTCCSIYVMRSDGSAPKRIVAHGSHPDWSEDGTRIAYNARDGIRFVTPEGVDVTPGGRSIEPRGTPAWSPDGTKLAISNVNGVYLVPAAGGSARLVTTRAGGRDLRPAWYPARRAHRHIQADWGAG